MQSADFNGDGHADLVVTGYDELYLTVYLGRGGGSFEPLALAARFPMGVDVGDFNEDGKTDIVTTLDSGASVFLGRGDGRFDEPTLSSIGAASMWCRVGEFNGDGHQDLVVTIWYGGFRILLGDGEGNFVLHGGPEGNYSGRPGTGDFNGDSRADVAIPGGTHVGLYFGNGDGTFSHELSDRVTVGSSPYSVEVVDVNRDGDLDLVVPNYGSEDVSVLLGNGDGTFDPQTTYAITVHQSGNPWRVAVADMNADAVLDMAVGNQWDDHVSVFLGYGDGTFGPERVVSTLANGGAIVAEDFDRDGDVDLAVASWQENVLFLVEGYGDGSFASHVRREFPTGDTPTAVAQGDFNEDGEEDLAVANFASDDLSVLFGDGTGGFSPPTILPAGPNPIAIASGDLNDSGHEDLVAANQTSRDASVFLGFGDGAFDEPIGVALGAVPTAIVSGRLNVDRYDDLVVASSDPSPAVTVRIGNGNGTFVVAQVVSLEAAPSSVVTSDLDGDTDQDLVVAAGSGVSVLLGAGDGTFGPENRFPSGGGVLARKVAVGDVDGDGVPDLVVTRADQLESVVLLKGSGDGTFGPPVSRPTLLYAGDVIITDLNGDSRPDLALTNRDHRGVGVLVGDGRGGFSPIDYYLTRGRGKVLTVGDYDNDGWVDVAVAHHWDAVSVLLNLSPTVLGFAPNKVSLGWPTDYDALSYSLYRGLLVDLVDQNADGLPDNGYGTCQTHRDPVTTDNQFLDTDVPPPGGGYFYLVAVVDPEGERDLGETSAGLPRFVPTPCP